MEDNLANIIHVGCEFQRRFIPNGGTAKPTRQKQLPPYTPENKKSGSLGSIIGGKRGVPRNNQSTKVWQGHFQNEEGGKKEQIISNKRKKKKIKKNIKEKVRFEACSQKTRGARGAWPSAPEKNRIFGKYGGAGLSPSDPWLRGKKRGWEWHEGGSLEEKRV